MLSTIAYSFSSIPLGIERRGGGKVDTMRYM
jgi:hypothetical protein